jgi:osmotically-inducible protein OsmY
VNIAKADPALDKDSHIVVTSFNGAVLLAGQTPRRPQGLAEQAASRPAREEGPQRTADLPPSGFLARHNDAWLTTKIKTQMLTDPTSPARASRCHRERHRLPAGPGPTGSRSGDQFGAKRFWRAEDR